MRGSFAWAWILPLVAAAACSSSLGSEVTDVPREGVTAPIPCARLADPRPTDTCPETPTVAAATAGATVVALLPVATAAYGSTARWAGVIAGRDIHRDGRPSGASASGWTLSFCDETSILQLDVTDGVCAARNLCDCQPAATCGPVVCDATNNSPFPAVDSAAAIAAAFPDDPATAAYDVSLDVRTGKWTVTRLSDTVSKVVDASTGAVVP
jgi:hypothetical protein